MLSRCVVCAIVVAGCRIGFEDRTAGDATGIGDSITTTPVDAAPGTLLPPDIADTYVQGLDTTPNGANIDLQCGRASGSGNNLWALWWFDLAGITGPISRATLRLYQYSSIGNLTISYEVYRITQTWDEASADWDHASSGVAWPIGGAVAPTVYFQRDVAIGTYGYYDWDVTTLVNEWLGGTPNYGLEIQYTTQPPTGNVAIFASKEHPTAVWRPQLLIAP